VPRRHHAADAVVGAVVVLAAMLAGRSVAGLPAAPAASHTITIEAMRFVPESVAVHAGDEVRWRNDDPFPHTVRSVAGGFQSPQIAPGRSWHWRVDRSGVLAYVCTLHPTMHAELRVN